MGTHIHTQKHRHIQKHLERKTKKCAKKRYTKIFTINYDTNLAFLIMYKKCGAWQ